MWDFTSFIVKLWLLEQTTDLSSKQEDLISHANVISMKDLRIDRAFGGISRLYTSRNVRGKVKDTTSSFLVCSDLLTFAFWNCSHYPGISAFTRVKDSIGFFRRASKCAACRGIWKTAGNLHPKPSSLRWRNAQVLSGFCVIMLSNKQNCGLEQRGDSCEEDRSIWTTVASFASAGCRCWSGTVPYNSTAEKTILGRKTLVLDGGLGGGIMSSLGKVFKTTKLQEWCRMYKM